MTLIDAERLQTLLVEYYDRLDQDAKSLVPLRRLYFPSDPAAGAPTSGSRTDLQTALQTNGGERGVTEWHRTPPR